MSVARAGLLAALAWCALAVAPACLAPPAELVVVVETDLAVPAQLDRLEIEVVGPSGGAPQTASVPLTGTAAGALPYQLVLVRSGAASGPVTVTVVGAHGDARVVRQRARARFVDGARRAMPVLLLGRCANQFCEDDPAQACGLGATCGAIDAQLGDWTAGTADPPVEVAPGATHTCARRRSGAVLCWGSNDNGQLGVGPPTARPAPAPVAVPELTDVAQLALGTYFTCARRRDGAVLCWGLNDQGQLGDGTLNSRGVPGAVRDVVDAVDIAAGAAHACAVTRAGGVVCWGANDRAQLGDPAQPAAARPFPAAVTGLGGAVSLAAGDRHTCALLGDGAVACWGANTSGQLGVAGPPEARATPVAVAGLASVVRLDVGDDHGCAVASDGVMRCWGSNDRGQLGVPPSVMPRTATPVTVPGLGPVAQVATGSSHTCALMAARGEVLCWGANGSGQLGDGGSADHAAPAPATLGAMLELRAGSYYNCAREAATGRALCWGVDLAGQVGDGAPSSREPTPVAVQGLP